jgi:uncharacterized membrane protein YgcG
MKKLIQGRKIADFEKKLKKLSQEKRRAVESSIRRKEDGSIDILDAVIIGSVIGSLLDSDSSSSSSFDSDFGSSSSSSDDFSGGGGDFGGGGASGDF